MDILVTGSSGLIGSKLCSYLAGENHRIIRMVRRSPKSADEIFWDPSSEKLDKQSLEGIDAVVNLAGENIASGRWTASKKQRILKSRIDGTYFLSRSLAGLFDPPKVLVSISAIGYYGNSGEKLKKEESAPGNGFLPELCKQWESATQPAIMRGIRTVIPRLGMVLSHDGGALSMMLPFFRLGIGGKISHGNQYISWIAIDDLVRIIHHVIQHDQIQGPINAVSPNPETNRLFTRTLGHVLSRPAFLTLPAFAARIIFGRMADEVLIAGTRASAEKLIASGYSFLFPELEGALRNLFSAGDEKS